MCYDIEAIKAKKRWKGLYSDSRNSEEFYKSYGEAFSALEKGATDDGVKRVHDLMRMAKTFSAYDELPGFYDTVFNNLK